VFGSLPQQAVNGSLWTLPIEARLYLALLVASLLGVLTPRRYTPLWAITMVGCVCLRGLAQPAAGMAGELHLVHRLLHHRHAVLAAPRTHPPGPWPLFALLAIAALARGTPWFHLPYFALACYGTLWLAFVPKLPVIRHNDLSYGLYLYGWPAAQLVQQFSPGGPCTTCCGRRCWPARWRRRRGSRSNGRRLD
jgi:peptidoglycan/LPS O-acetylase OafA/YrhL